jgi:MtN3 and saliva related transmembrane protein
MNWIKILGLVAGVCTASSLLPQVVKTIKQKKAEQVSLFMLIVLLSGQILWIVYGFAKSDIPIIATNCFSLLVDILMIVLRTKYKENG